MRSLSRWYVTWVFVTTLMCRMLPVNVDTLSTSDVGRRHITNGHTFWTMITHRLRCNAEISWPRLVTQNRAGAVGTTRQPLSRFKAVMSSPDGRDMGMRSPVSIGTVKESSVSQYRKTRKRKGRSATSWLDIWTLCTQAPLKLAGGGGVHNDRSPKRQTTLTNTR